MHRLSVLSNPLGEVSVTGNALVTVGAVKSESLFQIVKKFILMLLLL